MDISLKIAVIKLFLVNLIPVVGAVFFEWDVFHIITIYILESFVVCFLFLIRYYLISQKTGYTFFIALFLILFSLIPIVIILFFQVAILYGTLDTYSHSFFDMIDRSDIHLSKVSMYVPFLMLCAIELNNFRLQEKAKQDYNAIGFSKIINRIVVMTLYLVPCFAAALLFKQNLAIAIPFLIGAKIIMDYSVEDKRIWQMLKDKLRKSKKQVQ